MIYWIFVADCVSTRLWKYLCRWSCLTTELIFSTIRHKSKKNGLNAANFRKPISIYIKEDPLGQLKNIVSMWLNEANYLNSQVKSIHLKFSLFFFLIFMTTTSWDPWNLQFVTKWAQNYILIWLNICKSYKLRIINLLQKIFNILLNLIVITFYIKFQDQYFFI